jgi:hypothetical protein
MYGASTNTGVIVDSVIFGLSVTGQDQDTARSSA